MAGRFWVGDILGERLPWEGRGHHVSLPSLGSKACREVALFPSLWRFSVPDSTCQGSTGSWPNYLLPSWTKYTTHIVFTEIIQIKTSYCPSRYTYITEELEVEIEEMVKPRSSESYIGFGFDRLCCPSCRVSLTQVFVRTVTAYDAIQYLQLAGANPPPPSSLR